MSHLPLPPLSGPTPGSFSLKRQVIVPVRVQVKENFILRHGRILDQAAKELSAIPEAKMHIGPGPEPRLGIAKISRVHFAGIDGTSGACKENGAFAPVCTGFYHCVKEATPFQLLEGSQARQRPVQRPAETRSWLAMEDAIRGTEPSTEPFLTECRRE